MFKTPVCFRRCRAPLFPDIAWHKNLPRTKKIPWPSGNGSGSKFSTALVITSTISDYVGSDAAREHAALDSEWKWRLYCPNRHGMESIIIESLSIKVASNTVITTELKKFSKILGYILTNCLVAQVCVQVAAIGKKLTTLICKWTWFIGFAMWSSGSPFWDIIDCSGVGSSALGLRMNSLTRISLGLLERIGEERIVGRVPGDRYRVATSVDGQALLDAITNLYS